MSALKFQIALGVVSVFFLGVSASASETIANGVICANDATPTLRSASWELARSLGVPRPKVEDLDIGYVIDRALERLDQVDLLGNEYGSPIKGAQGAERARILFRKMSLLATDTKALGINLAPATGVASITMRRDCILVGLIAKRGSDYIIDRTRFESMTEGQRAAVILEAYLNEVRSRLVQRRARIGDTKEQSAYLARWLGYALNEVDFSRYADSKGEHRSKTLHSADWESFDKATGSGSLSIPKESEECELMKSKSRAFFEGVLARNPDAQAGHTNGLLRHFEEGYQYGDKTQPCQIGFFSAVELLKFKAKVESFRLRKEACRTRALTIAKRPEVLFIETIRVQEATSALDPPTVCTIVSIQGVSL